MATLSKLNILLKIAYPAWPFLIKKIFFSVGQGSGKLSLRASMEQQMVTFCSYIEYARPNILIEFWRILELNQSHQRMT